MLQTSNENENGAHSAFAEVEVFLFVKGVRLEIDFPGAKDFRRFSCNCVVVAVTNSIDSQYIKYPVLPSRPTSPTHTLRVWWRMASSYPLLNSAMPDIPRKEVSNFADELCSWIETLVRARASSTSPTYIHTHTPIPTHPAHHPPSPPPEVARISCDGRRSRRENSIAERHAKMYTLCNDLRSAPTTKYAMHISPLAAGIERETLCTMCLWLYRSSASLVPPSRSPTADWQHQNPSITMSTVLNERRHVSPRSIF